MTIGYSADALVYNALEGSWQLRSDYDPDLHRVNIAFTDDDDYFNGDVGADEVGSDTNQSAVVTDMQGNPVASGQVYDEEFYAVWDGVNPTIWIERVEIGGVHVGYVVSSALSTGTKYSELTRGDVDGPPTATTYSSFANVPCFGPGTLIETDVGQRPVEWIGQGDRIQTLDNGYQTVRWAGRFRLSAEDLVTMPQLSPICLSGATPGMRPLLVSPNHRVLLSGAKIELNFGLDEALVAARHLATGTPLPAGKGYTYHHLLFDRHEIIRSNGAWTESLFAGKVTDQIVSAAGVRMPPEITHHRTARTCLKGWEARLLPTDAPAHPADADLFRHAA